MSVQTVQALGASHGHATEHRLQPPVRRRWWGDVVIAVVSAHLAVVTALWISAGGVSSLTLGMSSALISIGRLAGLWSSALLLLQVIGMARIPMVERTFGQDRVTAWHRWCGFTSFWLLIVHLGAVLFGNAAVEGNNVFAETWTVSTTMPGMLLAVLGAVMIALAGFTSFAMSRRSMRYESWHLLHLYGYLGAGLALPHQLWNGTSLQSTGWAPGYWWALWAVAAVATLVFRLGVPIAINARHHIRVHNVWPDGEGLITVTMTGQHLDRLRAEAGQFFTFRFVTGPGWTRGHPLSLSAVPTTASLQVTINVSGDDGARIAAMQPGARVLIEGPYGRTSASSRRTRHILGIAAGAGIAPIAALVQDNASVGGDAIIYRHSRPEEASLSAQMSTLVQQANLRYFPLPGPRSHTGTSWLPADLGHTPGPQVIRDVTGGAVTEYDVFVCGPPAWTAAVVADARTAGVPTHNIHVETYTW